MKYSKEPSAAGLDAVRTLHHAPFWLDRESRPEPTVALRGFTSADLVVIGGGYTGLWTAYLAATRDPGRRIVLLEAGRIADGASGRNGGFVAPSLTHGLANGASRFEDELATLVRLGHENLDEIEKTVAGMDCDFTRSGELDVALAEHQLEGLAATAKIGIDLGERLELLDGAQARSRVHAPGIIGAVLDPSVALVDPAKLAWSLLKAVQDLGVVVHEHSAVQDIAPTAQGVSVRTDGGVIDASYVALATNAYPPLLSRIRNYVVPVYDYALMTEPLTAEQWDAIGWSGREGMSDAGNRFHYFRPTTDGRILWGGYNATYHPGNGFGPQYDSDPHEFALLATHLLEFFPQLEGIGFTHGWGGAIDTCSRFSPFWGTAHHGRTAYVAGYTGLGVGASRFGALVMLDLLDGVTNERTELSMVRKKPLPFPPEPLRGLGINWTTRSLAYADDHDGHRNTWLRTLDRIGLGFDS